MTSPSLHPAQLFHVGVVAEDIDQAMAEMSKNLGLTWRGGRAKTMDLCLFGEERRLEMRIAHSMEGPPHVELIEAVPGTHWAAPTATGVHHLCYWSDEAAEICQRLEADTANQRVTGKPGAPGGYFLTPSGLYIEIIGPELHTQLSDWIRRESRAL
jgi:hypothetical protein